MSQMILKWPVKGGPTCDGRCSASTYNPISTIDNVSGAPGCLYLVIDQSPLLKKRVDTHDGTDISGEVTPASRDSQIFNRVQSVGVDHKVAVVLVDGRGLAAVPTVEELRHGLALDVVDRVHVKPCAIAGQNDSMCL